MLYLKRPLSALRVQRSIVDVVADKVHIFKWTDITKLISTIKFEAKTNAALPLENED